MPCKFDFFFRKGNIHMKITRKGKRILSLLLAIVLLVSMLPSGVLPVSSQEVEQTTSQTEKHPDIGKTAKITSVFPVLWKDPTNNAPELQVSPTYGTMPALVKIVDVHHYSATLTLYKLDTADGSAWPAEYENYRWMESTKLRILEPCDKCGNFECGSSHENWCEICKVDDCTNDHLPQTVTDSEGNEITLIDVLGTDADEVHGHVERRVSLQAVRNLVHHGLHGRERTVIQMRYGLLDGRVYAQQEVADKLGISRSYVSRIEKKALEQLREAFEKGAK